MFKIVNGAAGGYGKDRRQLRRWFRDDARSGGLRAWGYGSAYQYRAAARLVITVKVTTGPNAHWEDKWVTGIVASRGDVGHRYDVWRRRGKRLAVSEAAALEALLDSDWAQE